MRITTESVVIVQLCKEEIEEMLKGFMYGKQIISSSFSPIHVEFHTDQEMVMIVKFSKQTVPPYTQ